MNDVKSLSHTSWNCKYHIVFDSVKLFSDFLENFKMV